MCFGFLRIGFGVRFVSVFLDLDCNVYAMVFLGSNWVSTVFNFVFVGLDGATLCVF